jgi:hypothetical protein
MDEEVRRGSVRRPSQALGLEGRHAQAKPGHGLGRVGLPSQNLGPRPTRDTVESGWVGSSGSKFL